MDIRSRTLVQLSALASRYDHRATLLEAIVRAKAEAEVSRTEIYEAFLQLYLFAGFPSGLEAMRALHKAWPITSDDSLVRAERETMSYPAFLERGQKLYREIYAGNAETVRSEMLKLSPELAAWAVIEGYGKTLSRPGLDVPTRELCIVGLLTQLGWERQLYSHILGATNVKATSNDIREAIEIGAMEDEDKQQMGMRLLDRITRA